MPSPERHRYTSEDYWNLPEGRRAELIDGQLYDMAPPSFPTKNLFPIFPVLSGIILLSMMEIAKWYPLLSLSISMPRTKAG